MRLSSLFLFFAFAAVCGLSLPAEARLGDSVPDARDLAQGHGAKAVKVHTDLPFPATPTARVIALTWVAPDAGWSLEEANGFLKLLVGARRRIMVKTSRAEQGYVYSFRYQDEVAARCIYENNRVRTITATAPAFVEADAAEEKTATFEFPAPD